MVSEGALWQGCGDRESRQPRRGSPRRLSGRHDDDAVAGGYAGGSVQDGVPDQQVFRGTRDDQEEPGDEDDPGGVPRGSRRVEGGGGSRAEVHLVADRLQRPVRRSGRDLADRVRDRHLSESNGGAELRGRRDTARLRGVEAQRRPKAVHVPLGGVHHRVRLPIRPKNPLAVPDARGASVRQVRLQGFGEDDRGHDGGETTHQGTIRGADHAGVQMRRPLAEIGLSLADRAHTLASSEHRGRGEDGRFRHAVEGVHRPPRETISDGGRRLGVVLHRRGESFAPGWQPKALPEHFENAEGQTPRSTGEPGHQLPHENPVAVRVRETPTRSGMGRDLHSGSYQRDPSAVDLLPAVSQVSALFPAELGSVQGQVAQRPGERGQASVETHQGVVDEQPSSGEAVAKENFHERRNVLLLVQDRGGTSHA